MVLSKVNSTQFQRMEINQVVFLGSWHFLSDNSIADFFDFEFYRISPEKSSSVAISFYPKLGRWAWSSNHLQEQAFCFVCQNGESQYLLKSYIQYVSIVRHSKNSIQDFLSKTLRDHSFNASNRKSYNTFLNE